MLSVEHCKRILDEAAPPGVTYTLEEAERLREVLYQIARLHLDAILNPQPDAEKPADNTR